MSTSSISIYLSFISNYLFIWASLAAQTVKNPSAMQETQVQALGQKDPLEKEMAIHSSILVWKFPRTEEPGRLQSMASQRIRHNWTTNAFRRLMELFCILEVVVVIRLYVFVEIHRTQQCKGWIVLHERYDISKQQMGALVQMCGTNCSSQN